MSTLQMSPKIMESAGFLAALFETIPCGVLIVDESRRIRAANKIFEHSLGLRPGSSIGSCQGAAMGCLNAMTDCDHAHELDVLSSECETCEARRLAVEALRDDRARRGRARFQVNVEGRVEDVTLNLTAAPFESEGSRYAIVVIEDVFRLRGLRRLATSETVFGMVGQAPRIREVFDTIRQVGPLDVPVLIQGESGTGKELVANALHAVSRRTDRLLVPVNCGALPDGLLESELFGHVKGAFTGAIRDKKGRFQLADGGTIFLDEIGELSPQMQVKFLRVLQDGTFERVGGEQTIEVDVRVICATNRDLESDVEAGRFRADLYYRLCVVPVQVPPLRERASDIPELVEHFLNETAREMDLCPRGITDDAVGRLTGYRWPGNVRELKNAIRFAVIKSRGTPVDVEHLPPHVLGDRGSKPVVSRRRKLERSAVREALESTRGNKSEAARALGVSRATLYRFLDEAGTS